MLAGAKETFQGWREGAIEEEMSAINSLLAGLIDYAGLYPPARLDMRSATRNYLDYSQGRQADFLGRFVVSIDQLNEFRQAAGDSPGDWRLSVVGNAQAARDSLPQYIESGFRIETIEIKVDRAAEIADISRHIPTGIPAYFEVPVGGSESEWLEAISSAGAGAKLRMGGVVAEAFPSPCAIANTVKAFVDRGIRFKATAGLHHPIRSLHSFTYDANGPTGMMHGFMNLSCAAALLYFGGEVSDAQRLLEEQDHTAWQMTEEAIGWRGFAWSADQIRSIRRDSLTSFGSCSFEEPIQDLEALGWL
jgi:hypothetical protein